MRWVRLPCMTAPPMWRTLSSRGGQCRESIGSDEKIIVISDSFKGTLSSAEICEIARQSVPRVLPGCELAAIPVADGGEGTVDCFIHTAGRPLWR